MMSLSELVLTRLLAMDSYNRGYGVTFPTSPGGFSPEVGNVNFVGQSDVKEGSPGVKEGFYAAAYEINGVTVISYRGTDDIWPELFVTDVPIMSGVWSDESVQLAMNFYNAVAAATDNPILLTGHSLGGGLP